MLIRTLTGWARANGEAALDALDADVSTATTARSPLDDEYKHRIHG